MKKKVVVLIGGFTALTIVLALNAAGQVPAGDGVQFTTDGKLMLPRDYREWVFLSSGLGMNYGPVASEARDGNPPFDNVFVSRAAYRSFLTSGRWPDKTMFILEVRGSQSKGSINHDGRFQSDVLGIEAELKDERFPGKWAFFAFGRNGAEGKQIPATAACYSCHAQHGAVDNTFVQFYPTLRTVAKDKGTFRADAQ